jgi:hypothetical protein
VELHLAVSPLWWATNIWPRFDANSSFDVDNLAVILRAIQPGVECVESLDSQ